MKAAVTRELAADFEMLDVQLDDPGPREVVVEVRASGLCHSDYATAQTNMLGAVLPTVLGHEVAGVVAAVGSDVGQLRVGDHVVGCMVQFCGQCAHCVQGKPTQCLDPGAIERPEGARSRLTLDGDPVSQGFVLGGFAEQVMVHENHLTKVPVDMPFAQAAIIGCGVVTGAGAILNTARVRHGDTVVIMGAGGVGLNGVQGAVLAGASRIIVTDIAENKLTLAQALGATDTIDSRRVDPVEAVRSLLPGGADHVFDFVGARAVTAQGLEMVGMGGGLFLIGVDGDDAGVEVSAPSLMFRHAKVQGVGMGSTNPRRDIPMFAELYLQGRYRLDELVTSTTSLSRINEAYAAMKDGVPGRPVITDFE